jgi:hypothetical protein
MEISGKRFEGRAFQQHPFRDCAQARWHSPALAILKKRSRPRVIETAEDRENTGIPAAPCSAR